MSDTAKLNRLFLAIVLVGALHMGEQLIFGVEEYHMLRDGVRTWWTWFPAVEAARASVLLITIVFTTLSLMMYGLLVGGGARLFVLGAFGVLGAQEIHHLFEAIAKRGYDPGLVTSFLYVWIGVWVLQVVWRTAWPNARFARAG